MAVVLETSELTNEQLAAEAAREGSDGPAFVELLHRLQDRIWRVCFRLMGNAEDAHDAAQEVFVKMFLQRAQFAGRSQYSTWVHGIAIRTCLMMRRGGGRRRRHESQAQEQARHDQSSQPSPNRSADAAIDLNQILAVLDEEDRALLIMKYAEDHTYEELAEMFGLSVSACKMRISRSRQRLQERFPEHHFGQGSD